MYIRVVKDNDSTINFDEWWDIMEKRFNVKDLHVFDIEGGIIFIDTEALEKIINWILGEKEIPNLEESNDILGDIESFDIDEKVFFEYYETTTSQEIWKGVTDTRGVWTHQSINIIEMNTQIEGEFEVTRFPGRKGYPSIIWG